MVWPERVGGAGCAVVDLDGLGRLGGRPDQGGARSGDNSFITVYGMLLQKQLFQQYWLDANKTIDFLTVEGMLIKEQLF